MGIPTSKQEGVLSSFKLYIVLALIAALYAWQNKNYQHHLSSHYLCGCSCNHLHNHQSCQNFFLPYSVKMYF